MGYVPAMENPIVSSISGPSGNEWWAVYAQEARMTEEQARSIRELRERYRFYATTAVRDIPRVFNF